MLDEGIMRQRLSVMTTKARVQEKKEMADMGLEQRNEMRDYCDGV